MSRCIRLHAAGLAALGTGLLAAGCMVGPGYVKPKSELPAHFVEQPVARHLTPVGAAWWQGLDDRILDRLIGDALAGGPDLAIARARVIEAREGLAAESSTLLPQVAAGAAYARQHGSAHVPQGTPPGGLGLGVDSNLWLAGFDAGWELDVFGGRRRAIEAAGATLGAADADREEAQLVLVSEVARDYVELRTAQRRLALARRIREIKLDALKLVRARFSSGLAGALDLAQARAELDDSRAEIPALEASERAAVYRLGALVGETPENLLPMLLPEGPIPTVRVDVPVGLPSDLIERRPDLRAAERRVAAESARIGEIEAGLFPHFALTGAAGFESLDAGDFLSGPSHYFAIGPSVSWQVFDAGRIRDHALAQRARTDEAVAQYRKAVLGALGEVETALVDYGQERVRSSALNEEVVARQRAVDLAERLYGHGIKSFLTVLDAERTLYAAQMALASADRDSADAFIALIKALGGGFRSIAQTVEPLGNRKRASSSISRVTTRRYV
jgi:outer membrane protein, multidrug efflux system